MSDLLLAVIAAALAWMTISAPVRAWLQHRAALRTRQRVVVNLVDGSALVGVVFARTSRSLTLAEAIVHEPKTTPVPADGQVVVDAERVLYVQVLPLVDVA